MLAFAVGTRATLGRRPTPLRDLCTERGRPCASMSPLNTPEIPALRARATMPMIAERALPGQKIRSDWAQEALQAGQRARRRAGRERAHHFARAKPRRRPPRTRRIDLRAVVTWHRPALERMHASAPLNDADSASARHGLDGRRCPCSLKLGGTRSARKRAQSRWPARIYACLSSRFFHPFDPVHRSRRARLSWLGTAGGRGGHVACCSLPSWAVWPARPGIVSTKSTRVSST